MGDDRVKILVTGANGQLGYDVCRELTKRNIAHKGADIADFDITDALATEQFIKSYHPDAVIHCSAYTAVDKAEDEAALCYKVNAEGTRNIAAVCRELDATLMYISTDYVYQGVGDEPYAVGDATGPLSVYGKSKLQGEQYVQELVDKYFIVRTAWVFGEHGNNFVKTMLRLGQERTELNVVADQIGSPTYTADLAVLLCDMIATDKYGVYHGTNQGYCSWAEFTEAIFAAAGYTTRVNHITSEQYPTKAVRPKNSRMCKKLLSIQGFERLPHWTDAVKRFVGEQTK